MATANSAAKDIPHIYNRKYMEYHGKRSNSLHHMLHIIFNEEKSKYLIPPPPYMYIHGRLV